MKRRIRPVHAALIAARSMRASIMNEPVDEALCARIRNRNDAAELTQEQLYKARLRARITLPKVKGYWE